MHRWVPSLLVLMLTLIWTSAVGADDWPQWMGPQRDNIWRESGIMKKFPPGGPKILWRAPVAGGYAGPAVAQGRVYLTDYVTKENVKVDNFDRKAFSGKERVLCLSEKSGKVLWQHEYPVRYTISYPRGPRCTPNVHDGKVYTLGAEGHLFCFDSLKGTVLWSKHLPTQYQTKTATWGYAGHPLVDGKKLICVAGGPGSHVVALDKNTGEEIWRALSSPEQGYSPPTIIEAGGVRQLILLRPDGVTSVDPESGKEYWSVAYQASTGSIIMSPVRSGNLLYVGGFSNKNLLLRLAGNRPAAEVVWQDLLKQAISPVVVQPFAENGMLYGFDQDGLLYGVELISGKRLWQSGKPLNVTRPLRTGSALMVKQGERFWMFNELGELLIAKLSRHGYQEIDRAKVIQPSNTAFGREVVWSAPAFANKKAFIRNDRQCICVDLSAQ